MSAVADYHLRWPVGHGAYECASIIANLLKISERPSLAALNDAGSLARSSSSASPSGRLRRQ